MEDQPPGRGGRINVFSQGPEAGAPRADGFHDLQEVLQRSGEAVSLRHRGDNLVAARIGATFWAIRESTK